MISTYPEKMIEDLKKEREQLREEIKRLNQIISDYNWQRDYDREMNPYDFSLDKSW